MNDSSFALLSKAEHWQGRLPLLHKGTRLLCKAHGVQSVTDYQPLAKMVTLACECKRPLFSSDATASYEDEKQIRSGSKRVAGNRMYQIREAA